MLTIQGKYTKADVMIDDVEESAIKQIHEMVNHPASVNPIVIMPDVHAGAGCVIGFTMKCGDKVVPNWVGVDIGCGIYSTRYSKIGMKGEIDLEKIDKLISENIPMGKNVHPFNKNGELFIDWMSHNRISLNDIIEIVERVGISYDYFNKSIGTLGGGNHFIEIGVSEDEFVHKDNIWTTIHSGSRNFGLKVANYWHNIAKEKSGLTSSPYLEGEDTKKYLKDMNIAQLYAKYNRICMNEVLYKIMKEIGLSANDYLGNYVVNEPCWGIETVHNYISPTDKIIRKGAISAREGEYVVVPFNMKDGLLICKGKGNKNWNFSGPHGAGRIMSRSNAKKNVTLKEFKESMKGVYSSCIDEARIDESPMAYKDASLIEKAIEPSLEIVYKVKPIYNRKG